MTKLIPIALLLLALAFDAKKPDPRSIPRRVVQNAPTPPSETNSAPNEPEKAEPVEILSESQNHSKQPEKQAEPPHVQKEKPQIPPVKPEIEKAQKEPMASAQKAPEPKFSKPAQTAKKSASAKISESSKENEVKNKQFVSEIQEQTDKKTENFKKKKEVQTENLETDKKSIHQKTLTKIDEKLDIMPEKSSPESSEPKSQQKIQDKGFGGHYESFVQTNIEFIEKLYSLIKEKAFPFYSALKSNKITSSIIVGFFYTFLILRLAIAIFPRKMASNPSDQKFLQQNFDKIEAQIKELFNSRPESDKKIDAILKRLSEMQSALDAIKSDKADDEFLDFLGKNIEDVWKEIGTIKSKINDNENSSNLDSFNARLESRPQAKVDQVATPEALDFETEGKLKFEDLGRPARDETSGGQELPPSGLPRTRPKLLPPSLPKKPILATKIPESPIKPVLPIKSNLQEETQALNFEANSGQITKEKPTPISRPLVSQTSVSQPPESEPNAEEQAKPKEAETAPGLPPKLPMNVNIFNKGKILPKTKNHITMPSMENLNANKEARPLPPTPGLPVEQTQEKIDEILPIDEPKEILGEKFIDSVKEPTSDSKKAEKIEEKETVDRPPLLPAKLPVRPSPMLKTAMKPLQMVRPLPKPQNMAEQAKGGEKGNLI